MKTFAITLSLLLLVQSSEPTRFTPPNQRPSLNSVAVVDRLQNTSPVFEAGPFVFSPESKTAEACVQACIRQPNCRSYYYGTDFDCEGSTKSCFLFPRPMQKETTPALGLAVALFPPNLPIAIAGNVKNGKTTALFPSSGYYYAEGILIKEKKIDKYADCEPLCLKDKNCKSWNFIWENSNRIICETFNRAIPFSSNENEEWKVSRRLLKNGFGGETGNIRRSVNPSCADGVWQKALIEYKECVVRMFNLKAVILFGCEKEINAVKKIMNDCGFDIKSSGGTLREGELAFPDCWYSEEKKK